MGLQFRRSIKIAPGIRINFGKKSTSISVGPRGAKVTMGTNGTHVSAGIPGTGIYYREKVSGKGNKQNIQSRQMQQGVPERTKGENRRNRQTLWGGCTDANPKLLLNDT